MGCITAQKRQQSRLYLQKAHKTEQFASLEQRNSIPIRFSKQPSEINAHKTVAQPLKIGQDNAAIAEKYITVKQTPITTPIAKPPPIIIKEISMAEQFQQYVPVSQRKIAREYMKLQKTKVELPLE